MQLLKCVEFEAAGGEMSKYAFTGPNDCKELVSASASPVIRTVSIRWWLAASLLSSSELRPIAMTRAPIARAIFTAARPNVPVAGAMMIVSPGLRLMSASPPYGTRSLKEVSFEYPSLIYTFDLEGRIQS